MISIVIPYMHQEWRLSLLLASVQTMPSRDVEICIVEGGKRQCLNKKDIKHDARLKYIFVETDRPFNRSWLINVGVRYLSEGEMLVLSDGDIVFTDTWAEVMYKTDYPVVAWSALYGLDRPDTETYLKEKILGTPRMTWRPTFRGACGGVNMVPRGVYYEIGGMVECFEGWGGEDNATWGKLMAFGYPFKYIDCHLWHLWHPQTLSRGRDRFRAYEMLNWSKQRWLRYTSEWGCLTGARTDLSITRTPDEDVAEDRNDLIVGPDHAEVHYNLGLAYAQKDMLDDAITEFKRALAIDPDFAGAHGNLGESYRRKDMLDDAITEFKRALAIDPNYAMPHNGLAVSYYQKGDRRKAIRHCRKAMELGIEVHPQLLEALGL